MKICAFEHASRVPYSGIAIVVPNWNKFSETTISPESYNGKIGISHNKAHIPDFRFWAIGEATKQPNLLGKRFPLHDYCEERYCWDFYYRQRKPERIRQTYRDQLDEMTAIMGDRSHVIMDDSELPPRTWPWSTRRNAWAMRDGRITDQREIITKQEVALTLAWMQKIAIEEDREISKHLMRILLMDGRKYLKPGAIEPYVAEWRHTPDCWPDSRFEQPSNARFHNPWLQPREVAA